MDNNNNKKKTCDYENQKKIIMKILPLPCPYRENWTQSDTTYLFNASSQITNSFISIHNFFIQNQMEQKTLTLNLLCCWLKIFCFFRCYTSTLGYGKACKKKVVKIYWGFSLKLYENSVVFPFCCNFSLNSLKRAAQLSNSVGCHGQTVLNVLED